MATNEDSSGQCALPGCGKSRREHDSDDIQHVFSEHGELNQKKKPSNTRREEPGFRTLVNTQLPGDPILRLILLDKGIISGEELENAERTLRQLGVIASGRPNTYRGDAPAGIVDRDL